MAHSIRPLSSSLNFAFILAKLKHAIGCIRLMNDRAYNLTAEQEFFVTAEL